ncbi:carboxypeptidase B-like [Pecten maximus]|uniref:carboxypeptidase B-like n=1 Tax=Pecten maximus TaxID=6579 RepID=UPI001458DA70|nr:carboxypeptidase B-like [Pecten maximus]
MKILGIVTLLCALDVILAEKVRFDGHKVLDIVPKTANDVHNIANMEEQFQLDFWHYPKYINDSFHVRVSPNDLEPFLSKLREMEATVRVWIDDVQRMVDMEERRRRERRSTEIDILKTYLTFDQINAYIAGQAAQHSNMKVSYLQNNTYLGKSIPVVKITNLVEEANKSIFIDCGIHAREWISPAFCLFVIKKLLSGKRQENALLAMYNWHIVPVLNPDGYVFSHTENRLWRKNRRQNRNNGKCPGVDLNRNFGYEYNPGVGGSKRHCSQIYTGANAFSEAESDGLRRYIMDNLDENFLSYLTIHSYGQMWLYPWGYKAEYPDDVVNLSLAAKYATAALKSVIGTDYVEGTSTEILYSAAGGSDDWAKGGANITYSYTLELRDTGFFGFTLPENQIEDTVLETWEGVKALAFFIANE